MRTKPYCVVVLLYPELELLDLAGPLQVLSSAGRTWNFRPFRVHAVAETLDAVLSLAQLSVVPTHDFAGCPDPEILVIPGGYGARRALGSEKTLSWLNATASRADRVLSIGSGGLLVAKLDSFQSAELALPAAAAKLCRDWERAPQISVDAAGVKSGKLRSTAFSGGALDLAFELVSELFGVKQALFVSSELGLRWAPAEAFRLEMKPPGGIRYPVLQGFAELYRSRVAVLPSFKIPS